MYDPTDAFTDPVARALFVLSCLVESSGSFAVFDDDPMIGFEVFRLTTEQRVPVSLALVNLARQIQGGDDADGL